MAAWQVGDEWRASGRAISDLQSGHVVVVAGHRPSDPCRLAAVTHVDGFGASPILCVRQLSLNESGGVDFGMHRPFRAHEVLAVSPFMLPMDQEELEEAKAHLAMYRMMRREPSDEDR